MPRVPQPAVFEVVGGGFHAYVERQAADVLAASGGALLPSLLTLVQEHKATGRELSEHTRGGVTVRVIETPSGLVVGVANGSGA